ncbi:hypothetical protein V8J38_11405 [Brevundimonas olei]|uniref:Uncharacterized protein n=1 Tax=Brevundimonas olei TaxID=657642 RepID=A0ABZ2IA99_9CAUL
MNSIVHVEVSGLTGSGKSAVMGEIEIALKALGLKVEHGPDFQAEKNGTHADWQQALDLYRPTVVLSERNVSRQPPAREDALPVAWMRLLAGQVTDLTCIEREGYLPLYFHPAPDALRVANLWWNAEDWEQTFNSLEDAYDAATGGEMCGVAKLGRATEHDPVWALRIDFDTTGDGEADDYEIRLFKSVEDARATLAAQQAEQGAK